MLGNYAFRINNIFPREHYVKNHPSLFLGPILQTQMDFDPSMDE